MHEVGCSSHELQSSRLCNFRTPNSTPTRGLQAADAARRGLGAGYCSATADPSVGVGAAKCDGAASRSDLVASKYQMKNSYRRRGGGLQRAEGKKMFDLIRVSPRSAAQRRQ